LIVALDVDRAGSAIALGRRLRGSVEMFKVGSQLFTAEGPNVVERLAKLGSGIFLDLKFHDIPNTVAGAVRSAAALPKVELLTLHASGGPQMMRAAREALEPKSERPALLGVTILTSMDAACIASVGLSGTPAERALALAQLAKESGLDGVVASAYEVAAIRKACGPEFLIVVPGVRPASADLNDQSRVATPAEATRAGANYLVVGRPITAAPDPREAAAAILAEIAGAGPG
jgi:orotidine-5'-phosphate decarboxylase